MTKSLAFSLLVAAFAFSVPAGLAQGNGWGFTPGPADSNTGQAASGGSQVLTGTANQGQAGYQTIDGTQYDTTWTQNNSPQVFGIQPQANNRTAATTVNGRQLQAANFNRPTAYGPVSVGTQLLSTFSTPVMPQSTFGGSSVSYSAGFPDPGPITGAGAPGMGIFWAPGGYYSLPAVGTGTCTGAINVTDQTGKFSPPEKNAPW